MTSSETTWDIRVSPGVDGDRIWVDGVVVRKGLSPDQSKAAREEVERLALCGEHDALVQLSACLADRREVD